RRLWWWEWRWWWLQQLNWWLGRYVSRRFASRAEADNQLTYHLALIAQGFSKGDGVQLGNGHQNWNSGGAPAVVSIVMPVYNQRAFMVEAIESIVSQTYPYWELIIVDDGSTDQLEAVLGPYRAHDRIAIYHRNHAGLPAALNFGFDQTRGDLLTWTSADNFLLPTNLDQMVNFLNRHPNVQGVYTNYLLLDERGEPYRRPVPGFYQSFTHPNKVGLSADVGQLNTSANFIGASFLYRRLLAKVVGQYSDNLGVEDYDFMMRANSLFTLSHLDSDAYLYGYRLHSNSLTGANWQSRHINRQVADLQRFDAIIRQPLYRLPCLVREYDPRLRLTAGAIWVLIVTVSSRQELQRLRGLKRGQRVVVIAAVTAGDSTAWLPELAALCDWIVLRHQTSGAKHILSARILINANPDWQSPFVKTLAYSTVAQRYQ
ncbi:MAG: glycosyltransferase, partial [bacterium]|nr:glycosyltransferase [bacterium]